MPDDSWPPTVEETDECLATVGKGPLAGRSCPLVQLDGRQSGQVTVDESRLPASTVLALFLGGCEVERVLGMYPWLDEAHAAVLHRLATDLRDRAELADGGIVTSVLFLLEYLDRQADREVVAGSVARVREQIRRSREFRPHARRDDPQRLQRRLDEVRRQVERTALLREFRGYLVETSEVSAGPAWDLIDRIDAAVPPPRASTADAGEVTR